MRRRKGKHDEGFGNQFQSPEERKLRPAVRSVSEERGPGGAHDGRTPAGGAGYPALHSLLRLEETLAGLRGFLRCLPGAEEKGVIYGTGAWDKGDALRRPAYEKAFEMGKSI